MDRTFIYVVVALLAISPAVMAYTDNTSPTSGDYLDIVTDLLSEYDAATGLLTPMTKSGALLDFACVELSSPTPGGGWDGPHSCGGSAQEITVDCPATAVCLNVRVALTGLHCSRATVHWYTGGPATNYPPECGRDIVTYRLLSDGENAPTGACTQARAYLYIDDVEVSSDWENYRNDAYQGC